MCQFCGLGAAARMSASASELPVDPAYRGTPLAAIDWGASVDLSDGVLEVAFAPGGQRYEDEDDDPIESVDWTPFEVEQVMAAFRTYEVFLPIEVVEVAPDAATFLLVKSFDVEPYGYMGTPDEGTPQLGGFSADALGPAYGSLTPGSLNFVTFIHEFGHGFGLAHPHDGGGSSDVMTGVAGPESPGWLGLNQGVFTTMTYHDGWPNGPTGQSPTEDWGWQKTPMAFDIAVLQDKYGARTDHAAGDDVYVLPDENEDGVGYAAIWDTGGTDRIRHAGEGSAVIDLNAATLAYEVGGGGFVSFVDGVYGGFTIANGVVIENATGGPAGDVIHGNGVANVLLGRGGDDMVLGFAGDDRLVGHAGHDRLDGGAGRDRVLGGAGDDTLTGNGGRDVVKGGSGDDELSGYLGNDVLLGGDGDDEIEGGNGRDAIAGGEGDDLIEAGGGGDRVAAGEGDDEVDAGLGDDRVAAGAGDDLVAGMAGNDSLDGGRGNDAIAGGGGRDDIAGGAGRDRLDGGAGEDAIDGGAGRDRIAGRGGDDVLSGGTGADFFRFGPGDGEDTVLDFETGRDRLVVRAFGFSDGEEVLARAAEVATDVRVDLSDEVVVTLVGLSLADLTADDFLV